MQGHVGLKHRAVAPADRHRALTPIRRIRKVVGVDGRGGTALAARLVDWGDRLLTVGAESGAVRYRLDGSRLDLVGLPRGVGTVAADLPLAGRHNGANAACVAAAAALAGVTSAGISAGLGSFGGVAGASRSKASRAASSSSMTTAITRRRSGRPWPRCVIATQDGPSGSRMSR